MDCKFVAREDDGWLDLPRLLRQHGLADPWRIPFGEEISLYGQLSTLQFASAGAL